MKIKQNITKEQWDEMDEKQKGLFIKNTPSFEYTNNNYPNIGQMIEFLGHNWDNNFVDYSQEHKSVMLPPYDVLCDQLWKNCKDKLKHKNIDELKNF